MPFLKIKNEADLCGVKENHSDSAPYCRKVVLL